MPKSSFCCIIVPLFALVIAVPGFSQTRVGKLGIGIDASMQYVLGAGTTNSFPAFGEGINFSYSALDNFGIRGKFCYSPINWKSSKGISFSTDIMSLNLYAGSNLMPNSILNIFPFIGGGLAIYDPRDNNGGHTFTNGIPAQNFDFHIITGVSIDYFFGEFWSLSLLDEYTLTNSQYYAGNVEGNTNNDIFMRVSLQVRYYFFDRAFLKKLFEAQRERSKKYR
jgi:hypothetical protein